MCCFDLFAWGGSKKSNAWVACSSFLNEHCLEEKVERPLMELSYVSKLDTNKCRPFKVQLFPRLETFSTIRRKTRTC